MRDLLYIVSIRLNIPEERRIEEFANLERPIARTRS